MKDQNFGNIIWGMVIVELGLKHKGNILYLFTSFEAVSPKIMSWPIKARNFEWHQHNLFPHCIVAMGKN
jgi:hypothetical protein